MQPKKRKINQNEAVTVVISNHYILMNTDFLNIKIRYSYVKYVSLFVRVAEYCFRSLSMVERSLRHNRGCDTIGIKKSIRFQTIVSLQPHTPQTKQPHQTNKQILFYHFFNKTDQTDNRNASKSQPKHPLRHNRGA